MVRILGQANPPANTYQVLYKVPDGARSVVATIYICNQSGSGGTVRVAVMYPSGSAGSQTHIFYDKAVAANDTLIAENITLGPGDMVWVRSNTLDFAFNIFGDEVPT